jgi:hypothetical protein
MKRLARRCGREFMTLALLNGRNKAVHMVADGTRKGQLQHAHSRSRIGSNPCRRIVAIVEDAVFSVQTKRFDTNLGASMDASALVLIMATGLAMPPSPEVETAKARKPGEIRRLERTKAWLHEHWEQQMRVLEESQSCVVQARSWGEVGLCARLAQQRVRVTETLQDSACMPQGDLASLESPNHP